MYKDLIDSIGSGGSITPSPDITYNNIAPVSACDTIFIDAGTRHLHLQAYSSDGSIIFDKVIPSNRDFSEVLSSTGLLKTGSSSVDPERIVITGKLASSVAERFGGGKQILSTAAFWMAAQDLIKLPENAGVNSLAIIDLSASGYLIIGIDRSGRLKDDLLLTNPHCGAGSGLHPPKRWTRFPPSTCRT